MLNRYVWIVLVMLGLPWFGNAGSLFEEGGWGDTLYSDVKAAKVGDLVTVIVVQNAKALQSTKTGRSKEAGLKGNASIQDGTGFLRFIPMGGADLSVGGSSNYSGSRSTSKQTNLIANVTTRVVEVLENDVLRIEGHQRVVINKDDVELIIQGLVRRTDINPDNSVRSSALADARIEYRDLVHKQKHGRVVQTITWPFRVIGSFVSRLF